MSRLFGLLGTLLFVALVAFLHVLEPSYAPTTSTVSEYALGRYGWVMNAAFFALALGSAALAQTLRSHQVLGGVSLAGLWLWTVGTAVAGVFTTDPGGNATSWHGVVHGVAASVALLSLYLAEVSAGVRTVRHRAYTPSARTLAVSTEMVCIAIPAIAALGVVHVLPFGLVERGIIAAHLLWLLCLDVLGVSARTPQKRR